MMRREVVQIIQCMLGWFAEGAGIHGLAENLLQSRFVKEKPAGMPIDVSNGRFIAAATRHTFPSAQSIIWSKGNRALYIVVVFHHIGTPKHSIMTQKENITSARIRMLSGVSGGGSFFLGAADTAFAGTCSALSTPGCDAAGACVDVDMLAMLNVASIPQGSFVHRGFVAKLQLLSGEVSRLLPRGVGHFHRQHRAAGPLGTTGCTYFRTAPYWTSKVIP